MVTTPDTPLPSKEMLRTAFNLRRGRTKRPCQVDRAMALRFLGHNGQEIDADLQERIEALACECERQLTPTYLWLTFAIDQRRSVWEGPNPCIYLQGTDLALPGTSVTRLVRGASYVTLLACTLGAGCERILARHASTNALDAAIFGACANALVEAGAEAAQEDIAACAQKQGLFARMRFSPGYGDLPLDIQPAFLHTCDATRQLGLACSESLLMVPTKSITAILGLFEELPPTVGVKPCAECVARDYCSYLEKGMTCHGL